MSHPVTIPNTQMKVLSVSFPRQTMESDLLMRLFSVRPVSPIAGAAGGSQPAQLPISTPSHPSYSFPSGHLDTLESRILQLEGQNMAARISEVEVAVADISVLKASVAQIPALQDEVTRLEAEHRRSEAELKARLAGLEIEVKGLVVENVSLKGRVTELEAMLDDHEEPRGIPMSSVIIHSPLRDTHSPPKDIHSPPKDSDADDHGKDANIAVAVGSGVAPMCVVSSTKQWALLTSVLTPDPSPRIPPSSVILPHPSPHLVNADVGSSRHLTSASTKMVPRNSLKTPTSQLSTA
jgi:hypothetical protein